MAYPHSRPETLADAIVHAAGLVFAIPAVIYLLTKTSDLTPAVWGAMVLYAVCLILAFAASAMYHMCPLDTLRPILHRIDHAAIYLKIAGSYTPFAVLLGTPLAYAVLATVWAMALGGAVAKLSFWPPNAPGSLALYLGMGWISALLIWPMSQAFSQVVVWLVIGGGLIYSAGTRIYAHPGMRYQNAIWHCFVLAASICLFGAVSLSV